VTLAACIIDPAKQTAAWSMNEGIRSFAAGIRRDDADSRQGPFTEKK